MTSPGSHPTERVRMKRGRRQDPPSPGRPRRPFRDGIKSPDLRPVEQRRRGRRSLGSSHFTETDTSHLFLPTPTSLPPYGPCPVRDTGSGSGHVVFHRKKPGTTGTRSNLSIWGGESRDQSKRPRSVPDPKTPGGVKTATESVRSEW